VIENGCREPKIFGKFDLHEAPKLRDWELYFGIEDRDGADAWKSKYPSIQKWLRHLRRYTKSTSTRSVYLRILHRFCQYTRYGPDELVKLPSEKVKTLIKYPVGYQRFKIIFLLLNLLSIPRTGYGRTGGRFDPGKNGCLFSAFER
jgi:hypothetical protein